MRTGISVLVLLAGLAGLAGCASLPERQAEWNVRRIPDTTNTAWMRAIAPVARQHDGLSGVELVPRGGDALSARMALADSAERTLDAQYYIWESDSAGRLLAERLLRAADRGVHVRVLLDDLGTSASDSDIPNDGQ